MASRKPLLITLIAVGTALVLGLGATTLVLFFDARAAARPEALVTRYLRDVQHGEIEKAMKLEGRTVDKEQVLLTDEAYAKVPEGVSGFRIVRVGSTGPREMRVEVELEAARQHATSTFTVRHGDDGPLGWLGIHAWKLVPISLGTVVLEVGTGSAVDVSLADTTVKWTGRLQTLLAFPGVYALAQTGTDWYSIAATDAPVAAFGQQVRLQAPSTLTPAGVEAATVATNAWVNGCLAGGAQPVGCSFGLESGAAEGEVWTNATWTMSSPPAVAFGRWDFGCGGAGCWPVSTTTSGVADFHADYSIPSTGETGDVYSSSSGDVDVEGSIVTVGADGAIFEPVSWQ